ncbi:MAG: glycosyltransferase [Syntrophales bacterium]|nr:glycosyltransferase [Syntrophales bacterium]
MIVKDEEEHLERCLTSVRPFVDEIIVVDTGSQDKTVAIAEKFGAKVYFHPWENDFAKHRNQSISYAKGDWILRLDADEELFAEDGPILRKTLKNSRVDYYFCEMHDMKRDGTEHGVFYQLRLFRNHMGMYFEHPVHEQLLVRGKGDYVRIRIRHYGYDLSPEKMEEKYRARLATLEDILRKHPDDLYMRNQLASCYSMHRDFAEAIKQGEIALEGRRKNNLKDSFFITTYYTVGQGYLALGKLEEGERIFLEALDFFPYHLDACYFLTLIYIDRRDWENGITFARRYLEIHEIFEKNPSLLGSHYCHHLGKKTEVLLHLAHCYFSSGDEEKAKGTFIQAFELANKKSELAEKIAYIYGKANKEEEALTWLAQAWEEGIKEGRLPSVLEKENRFFYSLGLHFARLKHIDQAISCLNQARDDYLSPTEMLEKTIVLSELLWVKGEIEPFISQLSRLVEISQARTLHQINKIEDIGTILYDIAHALEDKSERHSALLTLKLALQIHPAGFERQRFDSLLKNAPV